MSEFSTNVGLNSAANKQYAIARQAQSAGKKVEEDAGFSGREKGTVSNQQVVDMANPTLDAYITALATQEEVQKNKKKYEPTIESLKERLEKSLEDRYDNSHNMLAEAFYGFKVSTCSSLLGLLGADAAELEAIRKKAYEQAKDKLQAGYERLATAYAEYEIYAS
jgi:hypothetical protein